MILEDTNYLAGKCDRKRNLANIFARMRNQANRVYLDKNFIGTFF